MQRLIGIIQTFKEYFVLALLIIISLILLGSNDNTQIRAIRSHTLSSIGFLQNAFSVFPNVFELKRENTILRQLNVNLSDEVNRLRSAKLENIRLREMLQMKDRSYFKLIPADVIGKSLHLLRNTITLNVGENDGIKPDMPIVSESGLAGKIITISSHYSICQLMLNKDFRVSAKIQRTRVDGIVGWDGGDYVQMKNVAKTQDVKEGDAVTTSEYSSVFPKDIKIGIVAKVSEKQGNLFKEIAISPSTNFFTLEQVFVIASVQDTERVALEKRAGVLK